jgi:pimeloyl-ACP methyl ester carboxylesterase
MNTVTSQDGTTIAYDRIGHGPALVLVDGALNTRANGQMAGIAPLLAEHFTVFLYDRRGRGDSTDQTPYSVQREIEDLDAVIKEACGSAYVYGISSGGALALEAANRGSAITRLAVYEAPYVVDDSRPPAPDDFAGQVSALVAAGRRGAAVKAFMTEGVRVPAVFVALMGVMPMWSRLKKVANTLPYDLAIMGDGQLGKPLPPGKWASINVPTLVLGGGKSPAWLQNSAAAVAAAVPDASVRTLEGQTHLVKPRALAPVLTEFFTA